MTPDNARAAYEQARDNRKEAEAIERAAYLAWGAARVAYSIANPHLYAGKAVRQTVTQRGAYASAWDMERNPDRTVTIRGTVTLCDDPKGGGRYRNHQLPAGGWFVSSASGITAYPLNDQWELDQ